MNLSIVAGLLIPFLGTTAGAPACFFLKKTDWRQYSENIYRIRCRCHGGSFGVVFADTGHGYVRRDGEACISSRSDRILIGIVFLLFIDSMVPICMWEAMHRKAIRAV